VHNVLDERALQELLVGGKTADAVARSVVTMAIERGTRDNVTAVVVRYKESADA
jgi:serine/threonine protein phosphatase PrpC